SSVTVRSSGSSSMTRPSIPRIRAWWRPSATPPAWRSKTNAWLLRSAHSLTRSVRRGRGSSRRPMPNADASSGTSTPARHSGSAPPAMRATVARTPSPDAAELLDEATAELQTAISEVRGLARGVHPTILTEAGLAAAVDALAERTPLPVVALIPDRRYDAQLEATAYFVIAETLTNVSRYALATEARVTVEESDDRLVVAVSD